MAAARRRRARRGRPRPADPLARERALDALSRMRSDGLSLTAAARRSQTTPETVRKYVGSALRRAKRGRYEAKPSDRLTRRVWMLTPDGKAEIRIRSSKKASEIAEHMAAVHDYLRTGNTQALDAFRGKAVRASDETFEFITDPAILDRLALAGEVSFERLYVLRA